MAGEDKINPEHNRWLDHLKAQKVRARYQAAKVQTLARSLHLDPEKLASRIPEDTLRRLKFPVIERPSGPGMAEFIHDKGIIEGERPLLATDRGYLKEEK